RPTADDRLAVPGGAAVAGEDPQQRPLIRGGKVSRTETSSGSYSLSPRLARRGRGVERLHDAVDVTGPDLDGEREPADPQGVAVAQRRLQHRLAVDLNAVEAVQVLDVPGALLERQLAMAAADVRQRQAQAGLGVPADDDVRFVHLQHHP